jgi:hypothetical protein
LHQKGLNHLLRLDQGHQKVKRGLLADQFTYFLGADQGGTRYSSSVGVGQPDSESNIDWWWSQIRQIPTEHSSGVCMGQPDSQSNID